jgi:hypothetical protein
VRRETYPSSGLEGLIRVATIVGGQTLDRNAIRSRGATADSIRLAEVLGILEAVGVTSKYYKLTEQGSRLLIENEEEQKTRLFAVLLRDNRILPQYFKELVDRLELQDRSLTTPELSRELSMEDQWSADILNEWCRYLGISKGQNKTEVFIPSDHIRKMRQKAFALVLQEEYERLSGPSGLVPVARLRRELNDSGVLSPRQNFDDMLSALSNADEVRGQISFRPAPTGLVGQGLRGMEGSELISIKRDALMA